MSSNNDPSMVWFAGAFAVLGVVAVLPLAILWRGFVLSKLWLWFFVPAFHVQPINWAVASGVAGFLSLCTAGSPVNKSKPGDGEHSEAVRSFVFAAVNPAVALAVGWVVASWV